MTSRKPNVIFILADDMGYGDVSCLNSEGRLHTPNIDRIAREGLSCTDAHTTSAVCSPSRYSLLTGRYCWRILPKGVVQVYGDDLIPQDRLTVASLFQRSGYHTGCVGKWHIGMTWQKDSEGNPLLEEPVLGGPMSHGFQEYFGVDIPNWPPYSFLEGRKVYAPLTQWMTPAGNLRSVNKPGPAAENWDLEAILPTLTDRACEFIRRNQGDPFFLYFPMTSPHEPVAVADPWKGSSGIGDYGDFVLETDAMVGRVLDTLDQCGIAENTWVLFSTDNGCARYQGCDRMEAMGHFPSYHWRGYKADAWDGGHRVPFVMRWPACIQAGSTSDQYLTLGDFMATCADLLEIPLPDCAAEDSISFLPVMEGTGPSRRDSLIHHSFMGKFAVRKDGWKLILCSGSGGFPYLENGASPYDAIATAMGLPPYQLYNLKEDPQERYNIAKQHPEKCRELLALLEDAVEKGRTTPGAPQKNDIHVVIDPEIDGTPIIDD